MEPGVQSVMTFGAFLMPMWCAEYLGLIQVSLRIQMVHVCFKCLIVYTINTITCFLHIYLLIESELLI